jgi:hypothetical protein
MGMTIEDIIQGLKEIIIICNSVFAYDRKKYIDGAIDRLHKYQMLQADYENRLKADMVDMLTELQLEIEELNHKGSNCYRDGYTPFSEGVDDCKDIIQQKINSLKEA